jgi:hypothetical protein
MKKWQKITIASALLILILVGGGAMFNNYKNTKIALVDIEFSRNGLQSYREEVKEMSAVQAKQFKLDAVTVINTIYFTSKWAGELSTDLQNNPADAQTRAKIYVLATEIAIYSHKLGIKNDYRENGNKSQFMNFAKLLMNLRADYPKEFENILDIAINIYNSNKNTDVVTAISIFLQDAHLVKADPTKIIDFIFQIQKNTNSTHEMQSSIDRLLKLLNEADKIKKNRNNSDIPLAIVLDKNNINITEFLAKDDVDKMVILWNLSAKANAELSR